MAPKDTTDGHSSQEDLEHIHAVEGTEVDCLHREFRDEAEEIRQEVQNMMLQLPGIIMDAIQQEFRNHEQAQDRVGGRCQPLHRR
ncbi:UNVERIFIED_CONTAM: hypothetical protein K2H54_048885 [Gekko kuhli]